MQRILLLAAIIAAPLLFAACESELPQQDSQVPGKIERGISGQGTLYQPDRTSDPVIREQSRVGY